MTVENCDEKFPKQQCIPIWEYLTFQRMPDTAISLSANTNMSNAVSYLVFECT